MYLVSGWGGLVDTLVTESAGTVAVGILFGETTDVDTLVAGSEGTMAVRILFGETTDVGASMMPFFFRSLFSSLPLMGHLGPSEAL